MSQINEKAPLFELYNTNKEKVSLSSYAGETVILAFYPGAFTGWCDTELCDLQENMEEGHNGDSGQHASVEDSTGVREGNGAGAGGEGDHAPWRAEGGVDQARGGTFRPAGRAAAARWCAQPHLRGHRQGGRRPAVRGAEGAPGASAHLPLPRLHRLVRQRRHAARQQAGGRCPPARGVVAGRPGARASGARWATREREGMGGSLLLRAVGVARGELGAADREGVDILQNC